MNPIERLAYDLGQAGRVAWFYAHAELAGRLAPPILEPPEIAAPLPTRQQMIADLFELFRRDRANIDAGRYRVPGDLFGSPLSAPGRASGSSRTSAGSTGAGASRSTTRCGAARRASALPDYYAQNFHFQTDGYLSDHRPRCTTSRSRSCSRAAPTPCAARPSSRSPSSCAAADPRAAAAGRRLRHRPLLALHQAELPAPAGGRPRPERGLSSPRAPGARRLVMGRAG